MFPPLLIYHLSSASPLIFLSYFILLKIFVPSYCSLPLQITSCLFSVFLNFLAVFHLWCCAPFNFPCSILPLPLVPSSLLSRSLFSSPHLFSSPCLYSFPLYSDFATATKVQNKFTFESGWSHLTPEVSLEYVKWRT